MTALRPRSRLASLGLSLAVTTLGLGACDLRAELFEVALRPGQTATNTVCTGTATIAPQNYDSRVIGSTPSALRLSTTRVYSQSSTQFGVRFYSGCVEYSLTAAPTAAPGQYQIVVEYEYFLDILGTARVGGTTVTNRVVVPGCTFTLASTNAAIGASGGDGSFGVTAPNGCDWSAQTTHAWISLQGDESGNGDGVVSYRVAANPTFEPRQGEVTVAGQSHVIRQSAGAPRLGIELYAGIAVEGALGTPYRIEVSDVLDPPQWSLLARLVLTNSPTLFFDTASPATRPRRYYRAVQEGP